MQVTRIQQLGVLAPHRKIAEDLRALIRDGVWREGEAIPGENALAAKYHVSRVTVRKALKLLEAEEILRARQGAGRIIAKAPEVRTKARTIGVICYKFGSGYGEVDIISSLAARHGYRVHAFLLQDMTSNESLSRQLLELPDEDIAGIIILNQNIIDRQAVEWNRFLPVVAVYHDFSGNGIVSCTINWRAVAFEAASLFFETGFDRQLVLLNSLVFFKHINETILDGFEYAHHRHGLALDPGRVFYLPTERQPNHGRFLEPVRDCLAAGGPAGVFSYWNWPLLRLLDFARERKLRVPDDLSLIAGIDSPRLEEEACPVTAFRFDRRALVARAFDSLLACIERRRSSENEKLLFNVYGELVPRGSTVDRGSWIVDRGARPPLAAGLRFEV